MKQGKKEEAEEAKKKVTANAETVERLSTEEKEVEEKKLPDEDGVPVLRPSLQGLPR